MRAALAIALATVASCKTDREAPPASSGRPSSTSPATPSKPTPTTPSTPPPTADDGAFDLERLETIEPTFDGATPLAPLALVPEREQARQSWCFAGADAAAIAESIARTLERTGYARVSSRGTAERAGASGTQGNVQLSIIVGGTDARCQGRVAHAQYTTDTVVIPPLEEGERIR